MDNKKIAHKFLKFEDVQEETWYTITLNPDNGGQFWTQDNRCELFKQYHENLLKKMTIKDRNNIFTMHVHIEISPAGRLHFHGRIKIFRKFDFYLYVLYKLQQHYVYEIDTITDDDVWEEYITKQDISSRIEIGLDFKIMTKDFYTVKPKVVYKIDVQ